MDLRRAINEHVRVSRELLHRLRSNERETVTEVDLTILRIQLFLLDCEAANLREFKKRHRQDDGQTPTYRQPCPICEKPMEPIPHKNMAVIQ